MNRRSVVRRQIVLACALVAALAGSEQARSDETPLVSAHLVLAPASQAYAMPEPSAIVVGPDKTLWFAAKSLIGRITTSGTLTRFAVPSPYVVDNIVAGSDGALWFIDGDHNAIGRLTTSGAFKFFAIKGSIHVAGVTLGPDGNFWFADSKRGSIGRVSGNGKITRLVTAWPRGFDPLGIATGPDKRLWITDYDNNKIIAMTLDGRTQTFATTTKTSRPTIIVAGKDGNLWFVESNADQIGRITPAGKITEFPLKSYGGRDPKFNPRPLGLAWGFDGKLWFTGGTADMIRRLSPNGAIEDFNTKSIEVTPTGIVAGPDGNLWFTENSAAQIGMVTVAGTMREFPLIAEKSDAYAPAALAPAANGGLWLSKGSGEPSVGLLSSTGAFRELTRAVAAPWLTSDAHGNAWFIGSQGGGTIVEDRVGRLSADGTLTEYPIPKSEYAGIAIAPDGTVWLADAGANKISKMTMPGATVVQYSVPTPNSEPRRITVDFKGNAWFSEDHKIGRVTPNGSFTEFPIANQIAQLGQVAIDQRGTAWFVDNMWGGGLGSIDSTGKVSELKISGTGSHDGPTCVVVDRAGTVWFAVEGYPNSYVGRLVAGKPVLTPIPTQESSAAICSLGGDGRIWFTENRQLVAAGTLAKVSPGGTVTEYRLK
jgi:streptogramin lyase